MGSLRFDQINVVVPDVVGATGFLRSLGVEIPELSGEWADWAAHHIAIPASNDEFDADLDSPAFASHWGGLSKDFAGVVVNLRTEDRGSVDAAFDRALELGAEGLRGPYDAFWGSRYAVVRGPGPMTVGIMSPAEPKFRSEAPALSEFA